MLASGAVKHIIGYIGKRIVKFVFYLELKEEEEEEFIHITKLRQALRRPERPKRSKDRMQG